jgi:predicted ATPase
MNIGMSLLDSQDRKTELAQLNLLAGEQSKKSSAFYSAANYFMTGIGLLDVNWQNTSYDLAMKLYNSA